MIKPVRVEKKSAVSGKKENIQKMKKDKFAVVHFVVKEQVGLRCENEKEREREKVRKREC